MLPREVMCVQDKGIVSLKEIELMSTPWSSSKCFIGNKITSLLQHPGLLHLFHTFLAMLIL